MEGKCDELESRIGTLRESVSSSNDPRVRAAVAKLETRYYNEATKKYSELMNFCRERKKMLSR